MSNKQPRRMPLPLTPQSQHHTIHWIVAGLGAVAEYLALKYAITSLGWFAALCFSVAFYSYTKQRLSRTEPWIRYGVPGGVALILLLGTLLLVGVQQSDNGVQEPAYLFVSKIEALPGYSTVALNQRLSFKVSLTNGGSQPVNDAREIVALSMQPTNMSRELELQAADGFKRLRDFELERDKHVRGPPIAPTATTYKDAMTQPLEAAQVDAILTGKTRVCLYVWYRWTTLNAHTTDLTDCFRLTKLTGNQVVQGSITDWDICPTS